MIAVLFISIILIMLIWKKTYRKLWEKELSVNFSFEQSYVYVGDSIRLKEIIENRKRMPISPLEVRFRVKRALYFRTWTILPLVIMYIRGIFMLFWEDRESQEVYRFYVRSEGFMQSEMFR